MIHLRCASQVFLFLRVAFKVGIPFIRRLSGFSRRMWGSQLQCGLENLFIFVAVGKKRLFVRENPGVSWQERWVMDGLKVDWDVEVVILERSECLFDQC